MPRVCNVSRGERGVKEKGGKTSVNARHETCECEMRILTICCLSIIYNFSHLALARFDYYIGIRVFCSQALTICCAVVKKRGR